MAADDPTLLPAEPATEEGLAPPPEADELPIVEVDDSAPPPLGRSWVFDWTRETFMRGGRGPLESRGADTLRGWIDKCLHTERGALPIHPPEYGVVDARAIFGRPIAELSAQDLEERFKDALTFHPRIADVTDLVLHTDPTSDKAYAEFVIVTDPPTEEGALLTIRTTLET